jgi:iron complex transport system substrate-binding protein
VRIAGGVDVLGVGGAHSTTVPMERLAESRAEIVLIAPCGYDLARATAEARGLLDAAPWRWLRERTVWALDANAILSRPGPRLVDGVETLAGILHPSRFAAPNAALAARVA